MDTIGQKHQETIKQAGVQKLEAFMKALRDTANREISPQPFSSSMRIDAEINKAGGLEIKFGNSIPSSPTVQEAINEKLPQFKEALTKALPRHANQIKVKGSCVTLSQRATAYIAKAINEGKESDVTAQFVAALDNQQGHSI